MACSAGLVEIMPAVTTRSSPRSSRICQCSSRCVMSSATAKTASRRSQRGTAPEFAASLAAYLELHIEQGPVMVARGFPTAVVTGIRGNIRHKEIHCIGEAAHSGAVPRWLRRDAVFAVAELITHLDEHWQILLERGLDLVVTAGMISTNPAEHAMSRVPGEVRFSFEVRSQSSDTLEAFYHLMRTECRTIGAKRKVEFRFDRRLDTKPARMSEAWVERLLHLSRRLGLPAEAPGKVQQALD